MLAVITVLTVAAISQCKGGQAETSADDSPKQGEFTETDPVWIRADLPGTAVYLQKAPEFQDSGLVSREGAAVSSENDPEKEPVLLKGGTVTPKDDPALPKGGTVTPKEAPNVSNTAHVYNRTEKLTDKMSEMERCRYYMDRLQKDTEDAEKPAGSGQGSGNKQSGQTAEKQEQQVLIEAIGEYELPAVRKATLTRLIEKTQKEGFHIGFVMIDIRTGKGVAYNAEKEFYSASSVKAPFIISAAARKPEKIDTYEKTMLTVAVTSDNNLYSSLYNTFGTLNYKLWGMKSGAKSSFTKSQYTDYSAADLARLWLQSYEYITTDKENGSRVGSWFENPNYSAIHAVLKDIYTTQTKAGWISMSLQAAADAGIVYAGDSPYITAILSDYPGRLDKLEPFVKILEEIHADISGVRDALGKMSPAGSAKQELTAQNKDYGTAGYYYGGSSSKKSGSSKDSDKKDPSEEEKKDGPDSSGSGENGGSSDAESSENNGNGGQGNPGNSGSDGSGSGGSGGAENTGDGGSDAGSPGDSGNGGSGNPGDSGSDNSGSGGSGNSGDNGSDAGSSGSSGSSDAGSSGDGGAANPADGGSGGAESSGGTAEAPPAASEPGE